MNDDKWVGADCSKELKTKEDYEYIDPDIREIVLSLNKRGFKTTSSCSGTVKDHGEAKDCSVVIEYFFLSEEQLLKLLDAFFVVTYYIIPDKTIRVDMHPAMRFGVDGDDILPDDEVEGLLEEMLEIIIGDE